MKPLPLGGAFLLPNTSVFGKILLNDELPLTYLPKLTFQPLITDMLNAFGFAEP